MNKKIKTRTTTGKLAILAFLILYLDVVLKARFYSSGQCVLNYRFLYGIGFSHPLIDFVVVSFLLLFSFALSYYGFKRGNAFAYFIFPSIVAFSNYLDRIFRRAVVDYVHFPVYPLSSLFHYFNLCDASISVFVGIILILLLFGKIEF